MRTVVPIPSSLSISIRRRDPAPFHPKRRLKESRERVFPDASFIVLDFHEDLRVAERGADPNRPPLFQGGVARKEAHRFVREPLETVFLPRAGALRSFEMDR